MAIHTRSWRGLVKQNQVSFYLFLERVTRGAGNVLMTAFQRKVRLVMVEKRGPPLIAVVASGTIVCPRPKLAGMRVLMAIATISRGFRELHVRHGQFHIWRLVAIDAGHGPMRAHQRKLGLRMVELRYVFPLARRVARLTTERSPRGIARRHALRELPLMHIFMAGRAT